MQNSLETILNIVQSNTDGIIHHRNSSIHTIHTQRVWTLPSSHLPLSLNLYFPSMIPHSPFSVLYSLLPTCIPFFSVPTACLLPYPLFPVQSVPTFRISPVHCSLLPTYSHLIIHSPNSSSPFLPFSFFFSPPSSPFPVVWSVLHSLLSLYSFIPHPSFLSLLCLLGLALSFFSIFFLCFLLFLHFLSLCIFSYFPIHPFTFYFLFPFQLLKKQMFILLILPPIQSWLASCCNSSRCSIPRPILHRFLPSSKLLTYT